MRYNEQAVLQNAPPLSYGQAVYVPPGHGGVRPLSREGIAKRQRSYAGQTASKVLRQAE